jgi:RNA polymerase sigma-B factor
MSDQVEVKKKDQHEDSLLAEYCRTRDVDLRNQLVGKYLYIAEIIAKKFTNRGIEYDDLYQVASLALLKALERYDITKGFKFSSFATPTIVGEIKNYFRDKSRIIRLPRKESEYIKKIENAKNYLLNQFGRSPTPEEIGEYLGITSEQVLELMESNYSTKPAPIMKKVDIRNSKGSTDMEVASRLLLWTNSIRWL